MIRIFIGRAIEDEVVTWHHLEIAQNHTGIVHHAIVLDATAKSRYTSSQNADRFVVADVDWMSRFDARIGYVDVKSEMITLCAFDAAPDRIAHRASIASPALGARVIMCILILRREFQHTKSIDHHIALKTRIST